VWLKTPFRGAGNKTWSNSAGAGDDKTAGANFKWKAQNEGKYESRETAMIADERR
jgi:hypothetical protein